MNLMSCMRIPLLAVTVIMLGSVGVAAQTCGFTITDMSFGADVDTLSGGAADTTATLSYSCTGGAPSDRIRICVDLGEGSVASAGGVRRMAGESSYLQYELYANPERTNVWGSAGSSQTIVPIISILDANGTSSGNRTIYGRIFGGQSSADAISYASTFAGGDVDIRYQVTQDNDCVSGMGTSGGAVSFAVDATVAKKCLVSTEPVSFGAHGILSRNIDAIGAVSVTCTPATDYVIKLDGGEAAAAPTARKMSMGEKTITYGLYRNNERDQPWGDTEQTTATGIGSGSVQLHSVYGRVMPQATLACPHEVVRFQS